MAQLVDHYHNGKDWSWATDLAYQQTVAVLKNITKQNGLPLSLEKTDFSAEFLTDEPFQVLQDLIWDLSENCFLPFAERLRHKTAYFLQA